jgi:RimJ/RimL family protein N-acetyltransferase
MELYTDTLLIRPLKSVDILPFTAAVKASYSMLSPWLDWCHENFNYEDAQDWIQESQMAWQHKISHELGIFSRKTDDFLGCIYLHHLDEQTHSAQLGYWIDTRHQQQGFAKSALKVVIQWAWEHLDLVRIEIITHPENIASQNVAKTCGATYEGIARNKIYLRHTPIDGQVYALIPDEKSVF